MRYCVGAEGYLHAGVIISPFLDNNPRYLCLNSFVPTLCENPSMQHNLTANEARVIGCLLEKSIVTPDQYPLTTNALTNACNQKSARNPVMSLNTAVVQRTARELGERHLVQVEQNFKNGVEKYKHRFCNTTFSTYQFDPAQFAIVCLLLLRGAQTPGEMRAHSGRLHTFADNHAVVDALQQLIDHEGEPLVVQLPRTAGRKDCEYMHLFSGPIDIEALAAQSPQPAANTSSGREDLAARVTVLEAQVAELQAMLADRETSE
jgi:hypothetical protein